MAEQWNSFYAVHHIEHYRLTGNKTICQTNLKISDFGLILPCEIGIKIINYTLMLFLLKIEPPLLKDNGMSAVMR